MNPPNRGLVHTDPDPCLLLTLLSFPHPKCLADEGVFRSFSHYITRPFCMHRGRLLYVLAAWGGGHGREGWATPASHLYCCCCCLFVFFFFKHSLLSIKKPFLQPASDAHSLPLSMDGVPLSLTYQKCPCAVMKSCGVWTGMTSRHWPFSLVHGALRIWAWRMQSHFLSL